MMSEAMMDNNRLSCSLVIRCYNEEQHIGKLLSGIMNQTVKDVEIILVDSGSTDATLSIASRYPVRIVTIQPEEFSFGSSINVGCREASKEIIVLASAHVYPVYKDWLEHLLRAFENPEIALVYGKQRGDDSVRYSERQIYKKWYPEYSLHSQRHPFCNNANAAIRRSLWEHVRYNEELTGLEDIDWAKRVLDLGKKISYSADAEIIHVHNETARMIFNRYRREAMALKRIYPHENFYVWDFLRLFAANVLTDYYHAWKDRQLLKNFSRIVSFRLMQFWGTYRGFAQSTSVTEQLRGRFYYPNGLLREPHQSKEDEERLIEYEHH